jgi:hypothetical protein
MNKKILVVLSVMVLALPGRQGVALEDMIPREVLTSTESAALPEDLIDQGDIEGGTLRLRDIRKAGLRVFTTPYNRLDGYGDGPFNPDDPDHTSFENGNRPGIQTNYTPFLRANGLDAQTCLECHSVLSTSQMPPTFAVGGHGGSNNNAFFGPTEIDVNAFDETAGQSGPCAFFDGRFINPPFLFGAGGIELLAKEMTGELLNIKETCLESGGTYELATKGVHFGTIACSGGSVSNLSIDSSNKAIDEDLVVRPFGRKGEFATIRAFDQAATEFHLGMQPEEVMEERSGDPNADGDGDGITNELTVGEMSALSIFLSCLPTARSERLTPAAEDGEEIFHNMGCTNCHMPSLETEGRTLGKSFPEVATDPHENSFLSFTLWGPGCPTGFEKVAGGGLTIRLFADLKRHDMGERLAETAVSEQGDPSPLNRHFTTARLWGVGDSAPYLHDGRAQTLTEAILFHDGEAAEERAAFEALSDTDKNALLAFLRSLKVPRERAVRKALR